MTCISFSENSLFSTSQSTCLPTHELLKFSWIQDGPCLGNPQNVNLTGEVAKFFHQKCLHLIGDSQEKAKEFFQNYDFQLAKDFQTENKIDAYRVQAAALAGVDMERPINKLGQTPLHLASKNGDLELVRVLVNAGVNIDGYDQNQNTPLKLAATYGKIEVVRFLVSKGAKIDHANYYSVTPLMSAIFSDRLDVVKFLLQAGANPNTPLTFFKRTPLHFASSSCLPQGDIFVKELLQAGAKPNLRDIIGETPLSLSYISSIALCSRAKKSFSVLKDWCIKHKLDCSQKFTNLGYSFYFLERLTIMSIALGFAYILYKVLMKKKPDSEKIETDTKLEIEVNQPQNLESIESSNLLDVKDSYSK